MTALQWRRERLGFVYALGGHSQQQPRGDWGIERFAPAAASYARPLMLPRTVSDWPTSQCCHFSCVVALHERLYLIGGPSCRTTFSFCPRTRAWRKCADMAFPRSGFGVVALGDRIYAVGGSCGSPQALRDVEVFDPDQEGGSWLRAAPLVRPRHLLAVAAARGKVYAIGGFGTAHAGHSHAEDTVEMYDPEVDAWSLVRPMGVPRGFVAAAAVGDFIFAIGGFNHASGNLASVEKYDPRADVWAPAAPMHKARANAGAASCDGCIYVFGGEAGRNNAFREAERYSPRDDVWAELPAMEKYRAALAVAAL